MTADDRAELLIVGANHRSSSVALRDRLFIDAAKAPLVFRQLADCGIRQALVMSTCDRVEIQAVCGDPGAMAEPLFGLMGRMAGDDTLADQLYCLSEDEAVRHLFAVASALDSQTIGEPQVLGQLKECHRFAQAHDMVGSELEAVLQSAYATAKRVRTETDIGRRPVSIASAAERIARDVQGDLSGASVFLLGLADMGDLIVDQLRAAGVTRVTMSGPSQRTEATARRVGCNFTPFDGLEDALPEADIIVSAVGTGRLLVGADVMDRVLRRRRWRPVLLIDAAVPGDIESAVGELDGAFLYTLDDLERVAMEGRLVRGEAAGAAWRIVDEEVASWRRSRAGRDAVPAITALRDRFNALRAELLAESPDMDAEEATRLLVNRLLHQPSSEMRSLAEDSEAADLATAEQMLRKLFGLHDRK